MRDVCGVQGEQGWGGASLARRYAWVEFQMDLSPSLMLVLLWNGELLLSRCEQHDSTLESSITVLDILHYYACRVLVTDCCNCILWITNICSVPRCPRQHVPGVSAHLVPVLLEAGLAVTGGEVSGVVHHLQLAEDASARQHVHLHLLHHLHSEHRQLSWDILFIKVWANAATSKQWLIFLLSPII